MRLMAAVDAELTAMGSKNNTAVKAVLADFLKDAKVVDGKVTSKDATGAVTLAARVEAMKKDTTTDFLFGEVKQQRDGWKPGEGGDNGGKPGAGKKPSRDVLLRAGGLPCRQSRRETRRLRGATMTGITVSPRTVSLEDALRNLASTLTGKPVAQLPRTTGGHCPVHGRAYPHARRAQGGAGKPGGSHHPRSGGPYRHPHGNGPRYGLCDGQRGPFLCGSTRARPQLRSGHSAHTGGHGGL